MATLSAEDTALAGALVVPADAWKSAVDDLRERLARHERQEASE